VSEDEVIEWANPGMEDWEECHYKSVIPSEIIFCDFGVSCVVNSGRFNYSWRFRRMPRDPLLQAIVLARLEAQRVA
jgi:hypothetical protein